MLCVKLFHLLHRALKDKSSDILNLFTVHKSKKKTSKAWWINKESILPISLMFSLRAIVMQTDHWHIVIHIPSLSWTWVLFPGNQFQAQAQPFVIPEGIRYSCSLTSLYGRAHIRTNVNRSAVLCSILCFLKIFHQKSNNVVSNSPGFKSFFNLFFHLLCCQEDRKMKNASLTPMIQWYLPKHSVTGNYYIGSKHQRKNKKIAMKVKILTCG